ncbi:MAG: hypothetical protein LBL39_04465 [Planctomycetaceae bacterium]|nr:hypothetical protein [Planctomycetaceae bacterium]
MLQNLTTHTDMHNKKMKSATPKHKYNNRLPKIKLRRYINKRTTRSKKNMNNFLYPRENQIQCISVALSGATFVLQVAVLGTCYNHWAGGGS